MTKLRLLDLRHNNLQGQLEKPKAETVLVFTAVHCHCRAIDFKADKAMLEKLLPETILKIKQ